MSEKRELIEKVRGRECGACSLCCKLVAVGKPGETFQKPQGQWCQHCAKPGCSIHDERLPAPCADYKCLWLRGLMPEDWRPDRSRFLVHMEQSVGDKVWDRDGKTILENSPVWCVYTDRPDTHETKRCRRALKYLETLTVQIDGEWQGPFPVCLIPPRPAKRLIHIRGKTPGYVQLLRPEEAPR